MAVIATFFNPTLWAGVMALVYALVGAYVLLAQGSVLVRTQMLGVLVTSITWGVLVAQPGFFDLSGGFAAGFYGLQLVHLFSWYALVHRLLSGPYEQSMPEVVKRLLRLFWAVVLGASGWVCVRQDGLLRQEDPALRAAPGTDHPVLLDHDPALLVYQS